MEFFNLNITEKNEVPKTYICEDPYDCQAVWLLFGCRQCLILGIVVYDMHLKGIIIHINVTYRTSVRNLAKFFFRI